MSSDREGVESAYLEPAPGGRLTHRYGPQVHILSDPWALSVLGRLCSAECHGLEFHALLRRAFARLTQVASEQLVCATRTHATRMTGLEPRAVLPAWVIDRDQTAVIVDVARGGMIPSHVMQEELHLLLRDERVRVDHVYMQRVSDDLGRVTGIETAGSKIGGAVDGATVFVPDPMAATGSSMTYVLDLYRRELGFPRKVVLLHLIVTPEYLRRITDLAPDVEIYALRLDRGLSSAAVLAEVPGARWSEERGLTDSGYIVPGAGGLGEVINNVWV